MTASGFGELRVRSRRSYWAWRGLGAAAFAVACAWALRSGNLANQLMGTAGLVLFGALSMYALRQLLRRGPRLVLKEAGFEAADLKVGLVPWSEVIEVQAFGSAEAPFVLMRVAGTSPCLARLAGWPRLSVALLRRSGLPPFSINLIGIEGDSGEVIQRARALWLRARPRGVD